MPASDIGNRFDVYYVLTDTDSDGNGVNETVSAAAVIESCDSGADENNGLGARVVVPAASLARTKMTSNSSFTVTLADHTRPTAGEATRHIYFCARAKYSTDPDTNGRDPGPWVTSSAGTVTKQE